MKKSKFEKLLWFITLIGCILAAVCAWLGRFFQPIENYYYSSVILSLFSLGIISSSLFYFTKQLNRERDPIFIPTYAALVFYTIVVILQCFGIIQVGFLSEETKTLWMGVPILAFIWETRYIWGSIEFGKRDQKETKK